MFAKKSNLFMLILLLLVTSCDSPAPAMLTPANVNATPTPVSTLESPDATAAKSATTVPQNTALPTVIPAPSMLAPSLNGTQLSPTWSPDGQRVVFEYEDIGTSRRSLYAVDIASGELSRMTNRSTNDILPQFSRDGKNILFISQWFQSTWKTAVMVMNTDSGVVNQITDGVDYVIEAAWSPDGSQIAFVATHGGRDRLWTVNSDGSNMRILLTPILNTLRSLTWSPNGLSIVVNESDNSGDSAVELHVLDAETGETRLSQRLSVTDKQPRIQAAWSRDSQKLYYLSGLSLFAITLADMSRETVLTFPSAVNDYSISPDGAHIAYSMTDASNSEVINLYVSGIDGSNLRCYPHPGMSDIFAVWSPDGKRLVFESYVPHTGPVPLYVIQVDDLTPCAGSATN
jgi:Tol biopolymer transport system component